MSEEETQKQEIISNIISNLRRVFDPEIPLNIYELGLIYEIEFDTESKQAYIKMTLTSPACPAAEQILMDTEIAGYQVDGVEDVQMEVTWDPPWGPEFISEDGRLALGID